MPLSALPCRVLRPGFRSPASFNASLNVICRPFGLDSTRFSAEQHDGFFTLLTSAPATAQTVAEKLAQLDLQKPLAAIDAVDKAAWQARVDRVSTKCHSDATSIGNLFVKLQQVFTEKGVRKRLVEVAWLMDVSVPKAGVVDLDQCKLATARAMTRILEGQPTLEVDPSANVYRPK